MRGARLLRGAGGLLEDTNRDTVRLHRLHAESYRSLRSVDVKFGNLSVLIGANASGKSNILDCLRLLSQSVREGDFSQSVAERGGHLHLAWKGEPAADIRLELHFEHDQQSWRWDVRLNAFQDGLSAEEVLLDPDRKTVLHAKDGTGFWLSGRQKITLKQEPTECALSAASRDAQFPGREVADFVKRWSFFDPSPALLRKATFNHNWERLDPQGRNLAGRLFQLRRDDPERFDLVLSAARSLLGVPEELDFQENEDRIYFKQREPGLRFAVHQIGVSSGTLRVLALLTALLGESESHLVGLEEPENHIHPSALEGFAGYLKEASNTTQLVVTTHSPLLLDYLDDPSVILVVRKDPEWGTEVTASTGAEAVTVALRESGFGLGEFYQTTGFGA